MDDFLRIIFHARRFKAAVKDISIDQLEEIKVKLQKIIDDRIAEVEAAKIEDAEKVKKIRKYRELLAEEGIDPEELLDVPLEQKQRKKTPAKPKYEVWSEEGKHITWTGQGRMPNVFKSRIEAGETLETFLIDE